MHFNSQKECGDLRCTRWTSTGKILFAGLGERFRHEYRFRMSGILHVFRASRSAESGRKIPPKRKGGAFLRCPTTSEISHNEKRKVEQLHNTNISSYDIYVQLLWFVLQNMNQQLSRHVIQLEPNRRDIVLPFFHHFFICLFTF